MRTLLLIAASTMALAACGGTDVETAEAEYEVEDRAADTTLSEATPDVDQPPLEGDSPFVDEQDVAESRMAEGPVLGDDPLLREPVGEPVSLAGAYTIQIDGVDGDKTLVIDEGGATGTFDGEPVEIATMGDEMTFDAPLAVDGEPELMTFTGMLAEGRIDQGTVEAQGDGRSMTFVAARDDEATLMDDAEDAADELATEGEAVYERAEDTIRSEDEAPLADDEL